MQGVAAKGHGKIEYGEEMAGNILKHMVMCVVEKTRVSLSEEEVDVEFHIWVKGGKWEVGMMEPWGSDPISK